MEVKKTLKDVEVAQKVVFVRVDFNVPLNDKNEVTDNNRIVEAIPTIKYLQKKKAKIVLLSHLGKVTTESDLTNKSLAPVVAELQLLLNNSVLFNGFFEGPAVESTIQELNEGEIYVLENTRFADIKNQDNTLNLQAKRESKNDIALGMYWAGLADVFVNDAFGTIHRAHASNVGITQHIKTSCLGLLVGKEMEALAKLVDDPKRPYVAIMGGAKVSDKIAMIDKLLMLADKVIIGGGMSYTFNKAQGYEIGKSLYEPDLLPKVEAYLNGPYKDKIFLPVDYAVNDEFTNQPPRYSDEAHIAPNDMGLDIGPESVKAFAKVLEGAHTVFWNGPMGVFEMEHYATGTKAVCEMIANLNNCYSVIGGGDSAAAAKQLNFVKKFSHVSTGGGAAIAVLEQKSLPAYDLINNLN